MALKRIAAVLLALPLLHLTLARAAIVCDTHADSVTTTAADGHDEHAHRTHANGERPDSQRGLPDDDSGVAECCQALATCSLAFGAVSAASLASTTLVHADLPRLTRRVPLSRISAPEPPPPKA